MKAMPSTSARPRAILSFRAVNRRDPLGSGADFAGLDALVDSLWLATEAAVSA